MAGRGEAAAKGQTEHGMLEEQRNSLQHPMGLSFSSLFKQNYIYSLMCMWVWVCMRGHATACVEVGELVRDGFLLPPCGSWGRNSGDQALRLVLYPLGNLVAYSPSLPRGTLSNPKSGSQSRPGLGTWGQPRGRAKACGIFALPQSSVGYTASYRYVCLQPFLPTHSQIYFLKI